MSEPLILRVDSIRSLPPVRVDMGDIAALAADIDENGLLEPLGVTEGRGLVLGDRRLAAIKLLGWETVPVEVFSTSLGAAIRIRADQEGPGKPLDLEEKVRLSRRVASNLDTHIPREGFDKAGFEFRAYILGRGGLGKLALIQALGLSISTHNRIHHILAILDDQNRTPEHPKAHEALRLLRETGQASTAYDLIRRTLGTRQVSAKRAEAGGINGLGEQRRLFQRSLATLEGITHALAQIEDVHPYITAEERKPIVKRLGDARQDLLKTLKKLEEK